MSLSGNMHDARRMPLTLVAEEFYTNLWEDFNRVSCAQLRILKVLFCSDNGKADGINNMMIGEKGI